MHLFHVNASGTWRANYSLVRKQWPALSHEQQRKWSRAIAGNLKAGPYPYYPKQLRNITQQLQLIAKQ